MVSLDSSSKETGDGGGLRDSLDGKTFGRSSHVLASALYGSAAQCGPSGKDTASKDYSSCAAFTL